MLFPIKMTDDNYTKIYELIKGVEQIYDTYNTTRTSDEVGLGKNSLDDRDEEERYTESCNGFESDKELHGEEFKNKLHSIEGLVQKADFKSAREIIQATKKMIKSNVYENMDSGTRDLITTDLSTMNNLTYRLKE